MRLRTFLLPAALVLLLVSTAACGNDSEDEFVKKYLSKIEKKHTQKLSWISGHFTIDRINRDNDYNSFATYETTNLTDGIIPWLGEAKIIGLDFGMVFNRRFAWSIGGEYWFKLGESLEGTYFYEPAGTYIENPSTEITVYGATTSIQYYLMNPPNISGQFEKMALRTGVGVGFYKATWDVWEEYQNLNLATNSPEGDYASFQDQTVAFFGMVGIDYPTRIYNLVLGIDFGYQYLHFDNVAWYTADDEEVIATFTGDSDGRVDLGLSGFRGKIEIKHFISW